MYKTIAFLLLGFLIAGLPVIGQSSQAPFYNEIVAFKKLDQQQAPPANAILFIGSSSFRLWKDVNKDFPGQTIINRGFGGSNTLDVIRYADEIIFPYHPRQVVIYVGENDLAGNPPATAKETAKRVKALFHLIRNRLPDVPVVYVSIKPSIARQHLMPEMKKANKKIMKFLAQKKNTVFVDVYNKMLNGEGQPMNDIFIGDNLHMNDKGYAIWQKALAPYLPPQ